MLLKVATILLVTIGTIVSPHVNRFLQNPDIQGIQTTIGTGSTNFYDTGNEMKVLLEISYSDFVRSLSGFSTDSTFNKAMSLAVLKQKISQEDFISLFGKSFEQVDPKAKLSKIFNTLDLKDKVSLNSSNSDVLKVLNLEFDKVINKIIQILRKRIERLGVANPGIQQFQIKNRILVVLPGINDPKRVSKLIGVTANLEFWETFENNDVYPYLLEANKRLRDINNVTKSSVSGKDASIISGASDLTKKNFPLFSVLSPNASPDGKLLSGPVVGYAHYKDIVKVNEILNIPQIKSTFPRSMLLKWTAQPGEKNSDSYQLIALKVTNRDGRASIDGKAVVDARPVFGKNEDYYTVDINMNSDGILIWKQMTRANTGKRIAIVLDNYVQSVITVQNEISDGLCSITGSFANEEGQDLANLICSGKFPVPVTITSINSK